MFSTTKNNLRRILSKLKLGIGFTSAEKEVVDLANKIVSELKEMRRDKQC